MGFLFNSACFLKKWKVEKQEPVESHVVFSGEFLHSFIHNHYKTL